MTRYSADNVKFMDGQIGGWTDGQTQAKTIPLWPEGSRGYKLNHVYTAIFQSNKQVGYSLPP